MSEAFSKVTCPHCGQHIEYGPDYQLASIPCPTCSEIVPLFMQKDEAKPPKSKRASGHSKPRWGISTAMAGTEAAVWFTTRSAGRW